MLTVSMPVYNLPDGLLQKAADSVLSQDVDLTLVVVNDGGRHLSLRPDDRLIVYRLDRNRGRYFADAVVAEACNTRWFTTHDGDDWSEPGRYEAMLAGSDGVQVVAGGVVRHYLNGTVRHVSPGLPTDMVKGRWHPSALWDTAVYRRLAHPGFRFGYDAGLAAFARFCGTVGAVDLPAYHWVQREQSLTTAPETAMKSRDRRLVHRKLGRIYQRLQHAHRSMVTVEDCIGGRSHHLWPEVARHAAHLGVVLSGKGHYAGH